jgi:ketosteroid isomerase-like protein
MKHLFILAGFVCLIAMLLPACAPAPEPEPEAAAEPVFDQAEEDAALRNALETTRTAYNKHDVKAYAAMCDDIIESWDGSVKGRAAWEKMVSENLERQKDRQNKQLEEIGIIFVTPEVAIYKSRDEWTGDVDAEGNPLPPSKGLVARVFVKRNGNWLYAANFQRPIEE